VIAALYNEIEPYAADWLRNLVVAGHVAPGAVDARSIRELQPADLANVTQAHFFAGIGVWSYALRLAGWPDSVPVWTGSCPCQPFSAAGKRGGFSDERHLWPEWFRLIRQCRPPVIFGEQVASPDGLGWFDSVSSDLEAEGYAVGASDLCVAGVGGPHIRQRLYFVAYAMSAGRPAWRASTGDRQATRSGIIGGLADADKAGLRELGLGGLSGDGRSPRGHDADGRGTARLVGDSCGKGGGRNGGAGSRAQAQGDSQRLVDGRLGDQPFAPGANGLMGDADNAGPQGRGGDRDGSDKLPARASGLAGFWADAEWIYCTDNKWRAVEPGTQPLAHGTANRVGKLRAYGNAISAPVAATFIRAVMEVA